MEAFLTESEMHCGIRTLHVEEGYGTVNYEGPMWKQEWMATRESSAPFIVSNPLT